MVQSLNWWYYFLDAFGVPEVFYKAYFCTSLLKKFLQAIPIRINVQIVFFWNNCNISFEFPSIDLIKHFTKNYIFHQMWSSRWLEGICREPNPVKKNIDPKKIRQLFSFTSHGTQWIASRKYPGWWDSFLQCFLHIFRWLNIPFTCW